MGNTTISKGKKKGFTLVELIIVIAIIAILAAIAIPKFGDMRETSNKKADIATAKNIATIISAKIASGELEYSREFTDIHPIDAIPSLATTEWDGKSVIDLTDTKDGGLDGDMTPKTKGSGSEFFMTFADGTVKIYTADSGKSNKDSSLVEVYPEQTGIYAEK